MWLYTCGVIHIFRVYFSEMAERDIKEFLYAFLMKRYRIPPVYDVTSLGKYRFLCIFILDLFPNYESNVHHVNLLGDNRGFYCKLRVDGKCSKNKEKVFLSWILNVFLFLVGINYIGEGRSNSKRNAQANAANCFVAYLVHQGLLRPNEIPNSTTLSIINRMESHISFSSTKLLKVSHQFTLKIIIYIIYF